MPPIGSITHTCLNLASESQLYELYDQVNAMSGSVPIAELDFSIAQANPSPETYLYRITLADAREWRQRIDFSQSPSDPAMTFNVSDKWKVSEFALNRPIRDSLVHLYSAVGLRAINVLMDL